jgi:hypothetical protein
LNPPNLNADHLLHRIVAFRRLLRENMERVVPGRSVEEVPLEAFGVLLGDKYPHATALNRLHEQ